MASLKTLAAVGTVPLMLLAFLFAGEKLVSVARCAGPADVAKPEWTLDVEKMKAPEARAVGRIHGQAFTLNYAVLQNGVLTLGQDRGIARPLRGVYVQMLYKQNEDPHGRTWTIKPDQARDIPFISLLWEKPKDTQQHDSQDFPKGYAMVLELGPAEKGKCKGKIYLCLPDDERSVVAGTFEAVEK
ncbi:MAG: hypothetical protein JWL69_1974 [Phycisphaerales bacterium]|jgi:hypothetical protein|nr:hypothetical protein [Phycisphaerales bacterium]